MASNLNIIERYSSSTKAPLIIKTVIDIYKTTTLVLATPVKRSKIVMSITVLFVKIGF